MAEITEKRLVDDIDGSTPADRTVRLGVNNKIFEIDLTNEHAAEMLADLEKWTKHGRSVSPSKRRKTRTGAAANATDAEIRQWALDNNITRVPDRGRIRKEIIDAYNAAHS